MSNSLLEKMFASDSFEVLNQRLSAARVTLSERAHQLNEARKQNFGALKNELHSTLSLHTTNKSLAIDCAIVNGQLLLGSHVVLGLKATIELKDVFTLYKIDEVEQTSVIREQSIENSFLNNEEFLKEFNSLFRYYKDVSLFRFVQKSDFFYIIFKYGKSNDDLKVFGWRSRAGALYYEGVVSAKDAVTEFNNVVQEWVKTERKDFVNGKHPHISILDKVFIETIGGNLTIKIENNTQTGEGVYEEPVENKLQKLEDAHFWYFQSGDLILLKVLPYQEKDERYFIFNTITNQIVRCDAIGVSCTNLPEGQGFIFSNGYYLSSGEYRFFELSNKKYRFSQVLTSPNGEDYLFVFFDFESQTYVLYPYNIVSKSISNPIFTKGYAIDFSGKLFTLVLQDGTSHMHGIQVWLTSFVSQMEYQKNNDSSSSFYSKIGNANLVRALSDIYTILDLVKTKKPSISLFEALIKYSQNLLDHYFWLEAKEALGLKESIEILLKVSMDVVEEFERNKSIEISAKKVLLDLEEQTQSTIVNSNIVSSNDLESYIKGLLDIKRHIGILISAKSRKFIDIDGIEVLEQKTLDAKKILNDKFLQLLLSKNAFSNYFKEIEKIESQSAFLNKLVDVLSLEKRLEVLGEQVGAINDEISTVELQDMSVLSEIMESLAGLFAKLNQVKALYVNLKSSFTKKELDVKFNSQMKLFNQSLTGAISFADTTVRCDEQMARMLSNLDAMEAQFSDEDFFVEKIGQQRQEVISFFEDKKQVLKQQHQRKINSVEQTALVTLTSIQNRVNGLQSVEELNSFNASDVLVLKYKQSTERLFELGAATLADSLMSKFQYVTNNALRLIKDGNDIFLNNGNVMKMGNFQFVVNKEPIDFSIVDSGGVPSLHIGTTNFYNPIAGYDFGKYKNLGVSDSIAESQTVYRSGYLAWLIFDGLVDISEFTNKKLEDLTEVEILSLVNWVAAPRYKEMYVRGVHDVDAQKILLSLIKFKMNAKSLCFSPESRILALCTYLKQESDSLLDKIKDDFLKAIVIEEKTGNSIYKERSIDFVCNLMNKSEQGEIEDEIVREAASFFLETLLTGPVYYQDGSKMAYEKVVDSLGEVWDTNFSYFNFIDLSKVIESFANKTNIFNSFLSKEVAYFALLKKVKKKNEGLNLNVGLEVSNLLGSHNSVKDGILCFKFHDLIKEARYHHFKVLPLYEEYSTLKLRILEECKKTYQLETFVAKPLTSFVRNKLISDSYFKLIGTNLAKQIGTYGDNKKTDLMGLLLLISPPGYGKTTIIEYIAQKLGMVFVKINCPSLSHSIVSLDPQEAKDATSRREIEKINLAFEMQNNVMLYLDDIQHTNSEFLQKFISLCDGNRKVDGVFNGQSKTYDLKGKRFAIVMAGNPYTEAGKAFKIPDMLINRADVYNLGDILSGQKELFELSYIENSIGNNSVLSHLLQKDVSDIYLLINKAQGFGVDLGELKSDYSSEQIKEMVLVLQKMLHVQQVLLKVNLQYIKSSGMDDKNRDEPPFKLQGSYRNMNKISEKITSNMSFEEVQKLILDHYVGESQTLTVAAEENLLKLREIMGLINENEVRRLTEIKSNFRRQVRTGGNDVDGFTKIANELANISEHFLGLKNGN